MKDPEALVPARNCWIPETPELPGCPSSGPFRCPGGQAETLRLQSLCSWNPSLATQVPPEPDSSAVPGELLPGWEL